MARPLMSGTTIPICVLATLLTSGASAGNGEMYRGAVADDRVAECGIIVSRDETTRIEPFLVGHDDLEGRLVLNVQKKGISGTSQLSQTSMFANGTLGRVSSAFERSSDLTVEMIVTDRSGKILCEMPRSMVAGSAAKKI